MKRLVAILLLFCCVIVFGQVTTTPAFRGASFFVPSSGFAMPSGIQLQFESSSFSNTNGFPITNWTGIANGWDATNTTSKGYLTNNYFGSQPAVKFEGGSASSSFLIINPSSYSVLSNVSGATIMVIARDENSISAGGYRSPVYISTGLNAARAGMFYGTGSGYEIAARVRTLDGDAGVNASSPPNRSTNSHLAVARINFAIGKVELWTNGVACSTNTLISATNTSATASALISLGGDSVDAAFTGWLGAALVGNRYLTDSEMSATSSYLKTKYSIP